MSGAAQTRVHLWSIYPRLLRLGIRISLASALVQFLHSTLLALPIPSLPSCWHLLGVSSHHLVHLLAAISYDSPSPTFILRRSPHSIRQESASLTASSPLHPTMLRWSWNHTRYYNLARLLFSSLGQIVSVLDANAFQLRTTVIMVLRRLRRTLERQRRTPCARHLTHRGPKPLSPTYQ